MPNQPFPPKDPYKNPVKEPKNPWQRNLKEKPNTQQRRQPHISSGLGKHRKSFGHV